MKKNKKLVIIVSVLLLGIGISLAYFLGKTLFTGEGATTKGTVATLNRATFTIEGELTFNDESIYPGHKTVSIIVGTATGDNVLIPYNIIWNGSNGLNAELKYTVYKSNEQKEVSATCEKKTKVRNGKQYLNEDCNISNLEGLEKVNEGTIGKKTESTEVYVANEEFITATNPSTKVYYYVVIEYPNLEENQNEDIGGTFEGTLSAKLSEATADITITTIYQQQEDKEYKEVDKIPDTETYTLNTKSSTCTHNAKPTWNDGLVVENLSKTGTECELYFDKKKTAKDTLAQLGITPISQEIGDITGPSCNQEKCYAYTSVNSMQQNGLYKAGEDDDGLSYIFRGTIDNNWVKFGKTDKDEDIWWRIIRINGDGTIRMIYSGITIGNNIPSATGTTTQISKSAYNIILNDNTYIDYYYGLTEGTKYDDTHSNSYPSTVAGVVNNWFSTLTKLNTEPYRSQIDNNAGFCNDREINTTSKWWTYEGDSNKGTGTVATAYGPFPRFLTANNDWRTDKNEPILKCKQKDKDLYTLKEKANQGNKVLEYPVGLITADEVVLAGGFGGQYNTSYWLHTGEYYWTMSPRYFNTNGYAYMFDVYDIGSIGDAGVSNTGIGVRPVINLKSDNVTLQNPSGDNKGTTSNPYIVDID